MVKPKVVIGDGWAALGLVAKFLPEHPVCWISGSRTRISAPLPGIEPGVPVEVLRDIATRWEIDCGALTEGNTLRQYRGKTFREPVWEKNQTDQASDARLKIMNETLWAPENRWAGNAGARFNLSLSEIEESLHKKILSSHADSNTLPLRRIEGLPLLGILPVSGTGASSEFEQKVVLGSGEEIHCSEVYYADRWSLLVGLDGMPRPIPFLRNRDAVGALQANFVHKAPVGLGVQESFFASLHREAGEEVERHVWGFFYADGMRSSWSLCLAPEEVEDNHSIAKKLRRMKSTLDRVFAGSEIIPQGFDSFGATLADEQVRFEEEAVFSGGTPLVKALSLPERPGLFFLTDGYGPSSSLAQVGSLSAQA